MKNYLKIEAVFIFLILSGGYYFFSIGSGESSNLFLSISTFLFAILAGFFISRQGRRYNQIRDTIARFDGEMTSIYRHSKHVSVSMQGKVKTIIKKHYEAIIKNRSWDWHFAHKSDTISKLHELCETETGGKALKNLEHLGLQRILIGLEELQIARKTMISLHKERMPTFQYVLIYFLAIILLITVSMIPSEGIFLASVLKGAFSSSVMFILIILHEFDRLKFFEKIIGESSAKDILDILSGNK